YGHYKWLVLPFGMSNGPGGFQKRVNRLLIKYVDIFVIVYMDDLLIYSKTLQEHVEHLKLVLKALSEADLILNIDKCKFFATETRFLGHILTHHGSTPDPRNIEKVQLANAKNDHGCTWIQQPGQPLSALYQEFRKDGAAANEPSQRIPKERYPHHLDRQRRRSIPDSQE